MNMLKLGGITAATALLAACAATPEQIAAREAAQKRYEQDLQISLAAQCDRETAELIAQKFNPLPAMSSKEQQDFRVRFVSKVNDPVFQACYRLAWENHIARERIERMERYYRRYDMFAPWNSPFWWW